VREDKDRSTKWMLEHHGDSVLRLSGVSGFLSWRSVRSELTHPRQLPDGLLEATFPGQAEPALYVVEVATYTERRAEEEAARNAMLVFLERGVVPEVLTVVLRPRGNLRVTGDWQLASGSGRTRITVRSVVVEMWTQSADALLATGDVGLGPWATLAETTEPPEILLRRCRERIEQAPPEERANLVAVAQVLAGLRYNDPSLLTILGGRQAMIESPVLIDLLNERERDVAHRWILQNLEARFGTVPESLAAQVRTVQALDRLDNLHRLAAVCDNLDAFRARLNV
jgi:hypothetical protein